MENLRRSSASILTSEKFLSEEEYLWLKAHVSRSVKRDDVLINLALVTGARAQEILNLTKSDFHSDLTVKITALKGSRSRIIPIPMDLYERCVSLPGERLFPITYKRLFQIWKKYSKKKFHSLRHTFAVRLYQKCRDVRLVQTALGHRDLKSTMVYLDYIYATEHLRKVMNG